MPRKGSVLREFPILVVVALLVSLLIKTFLVQFFFIPSGSMETTLQIQDRVAVNKVPFISKTIKRGDVVVFHDPADWLGEAPESIEPFLISKIREGLIAVGVLPDPAKQHLVKRVIGVAGDHIICCDKKKHLIINEVSVTEPYIIEGDDPSDTEFEITVPKGKIWVMGDHRAASADSRYQPDSANNGLVPLSKVVGRASFIVWPIGNISIIEKGEDLKKIPVKDKP